jgi:hypothetical protein
MLCEEVAVLIRDSVLRNDTKVLILVGFFDKAGLGT